MSVNELEARYGVASRQRSAGFRVSGSVPLRLGLLFLWTAGCGQSPHSFLGKDDFQQQPDSNGILEAAVTEPHGIFPITFGDRSLEHSNGNKIVLGRFNSLHAVYENNDFIKYTTSLDGSSWTPPVNVSGSTPSALPSIGSDSTGNIGVVWVTNIGANGLGTLKYAYRAVASTTWTQSTLTNSGTEPAIVGQGSSMHVTWTSLQKVHYASFPTLSPPTSPLVSGEILESSSCSKTGFRKPSIALVASPCKLPVPRIAYLAYSDEQGTTGACQSNQTRIGPHVFERNNTTSAWSLIYDNTLTETLPSSSVEPISCSLSTSFATGTTFLAWSDQRSGSARTMLARGQGNTWTTSAFSASRQAVHVRATGTSSASATQFRIAWVGGGAPQWDEFYSWEGAGWKPATWTGSSPGWGTPISPLSGTQGARAGRPQTLRWTRCAAGEYSTINTYFELEGACGAAAIATDLESGSSCPQTPIPQASASSCAKYIVALAQLTTTTGTQTLVDTTEIGTVSKLGATSATIVTDAGGTVTATWQNGSVVASWDTGFTLTAPRATVRFSSRDTSFSVSDYGVLKEYGTTQKQAPRLCFQ